MFSPIVMLPFTFRPGSALERGVLRDQLAGLPGERGSVRFGPPIVQAAVGGELAALVVETVADFMC